MKNTNHYQKQIENFLIMENKVKCPYKSSCDNDPLIDQTCGCWNYVGQLQQEYKELREKIHQGNYQDIEPEMYRIEKELSEYGAKP